MKHIKTFESFVGDVNEIQKAKAVAVAADYIAPNVKSFLDKGDFEVITQKNLKVGDDIVKKDNMLFAEIAGISGDVITV